MNITLWCIAGLLAAINLAAGIMKLLTSREVLATKLEWVNGAPAWSPRGIGAVEVLGAVGIILPGAVGVATILVPVAAVGLGLIQVGAAITNIRHRATSHLLINIVLVALAFVVAWERFGHYSF